MVSVRKIVNKKGISYEAFISLGLDHKTGKYSHKSFTAKTKSEARKQAEEYERNVRTGIDIALGSRTFAEVVPIYWETYISEKQPATSTTYHYKQIFVQLNEALGNIPFNKITSAKLRATVYAANTSRMSYMRLIVLRGIFKWAMQETPPLIEVNPVANIKAPVKSKSRPPVIYSEEQLIRILDAAKGTMLEHVLHVQFRLALRVGELRGLRWQDIDLFDKPTSRGKSGVATIQWQLPTLESNFSGEEMFVPTKGKDKRELPIDAELARTLNYIQVEQHKAALRLGNLWSEMDLVFPRMVIDVKQDQAGIPLSWPTYKSTLKKILVESGVGGRASSHAFRHTCAAHMLSKGIPLNLVSKYLGHTMISTTDSYYGHLVSNALDELPAVLLRRA